MLNEFWLEQQKRWREESVDSSWFGSNVLYTWKVRHGCQGYFCSGRSQVPFMWWELMLPTNVLTPLWSREQEGRGTAPVSPLLAMGCWGREEFQIFDFPAPTREFKEEKWGARIKSKGSVGAGLTPLLWSGQRGLHGQVRQSCSFCNRESGWEISGFGKYYCQLWLHI